MVKLGDVCKKGSSNIAQKDLEGHDGNYPIYGASGYIKGVDFYQMENAYIAVVKDGAGIGRIMKLPGKSSVIGTMQYIIPNDSVDIGYLAYAMEHMNLAKYYSGATIPHIYFKDYQKELFPLPSLDEQRKIAAVLDKISGLIAKRRQQLDKLDELVKSRFVEMFGAYTETARLSDVATISGGLTKSTKRDKLPLRMPYLRVANVSFASIDVSEMLSIGLTDEEYSKTLLQRGDLLFVEGNGSPDQIGRVAIWENQVIPCVHQNHLIKSRFNKELVIPSFAMYYFMSSKGREQIKGKAVSTSGLYTLSVSKISDLMLPTPPLDLQKQFAAFIAYTNKLKLAVQKSLEKLEILKKALMQEYFG